MRVLLHFAQFCIQRHMCHPPYGPWEHDPPHVWTNKSNSAATQDQGEDEADVCVCVCVCYVVGSAPPSQFVVSATSIILGNVLMPTLAKNKLFIRQYMIDTH